MSIKLLGNRLLVKRLNTPETSKGGLIVLGREKPNMGIVIAIGNGPRSGKHGIGERIPIDDIEVGDEVTFDKWAGEASKAPSELDEDLLIMEYDQCFLRVRN